MKLEGLVGNLVKLKMPLRSLSTAAATKTYIEIHPVFLLNVIHNYLTRITITYS